MSVNNKAGYNITVDPLEPKSLFDNDDTPEGDVSNSTVIFSEGNDDNLVSGSTLSVLFGKLKYFIKNVISKIGNAIIATASVDSTSGTPSVTVTKEIVGNDIRLNFAFSGIKGEGASVDGIMINVDDDYTNNGRISSIEIIKQGNSQLISIDTINQSDETETFVDGFYTVPTGGLQNQILRKKTSTNGDFEWSDELVPTGGEAGQVLKKYGSGDSQNYWADSHEIPSGGTIGQVLRKYSDTNYMASWSTIREVPSGGEVGQVLMKTANGYEWVTLS